MAELFDGVTVAPDAGPRPIVNSEGEVIVENACPFEYCYFGEWQLTEGIVLRGAPKVGADSVGFVPALKPICADSGIVVIDPPGMVVITRPPPGRSGFYPFEPGDTIVVLDYASEGWWNLLWRESQIVAPVYWNGEQYADQVVRPARNLWWVHVRDDSTGAAGWILKSDRTGGETRQGDGGGFSDDRMFLKTTPPC